MFAIQATTDLRRIETQKPSASRVAAEEAIRVIDHFYSVHKHTLESLSSLASRYGLESLAAEVPSFPLLEAVGDVKKMWEIASSEVALETPLVAVASQEVEP